jgi:carboxymethylenebutenolidase
MDGLTRSEMIEMPDGSEMRAFVALPEAGHGPGLLVLMEIFGVGTYIRRAAERLAELGYVALAPDLYRRTAPGLELAHDQEGLRAAGAAVGKLDVAGAVQDSLTALEHLRGLPEVDGPTGVLGFCLGGSLAFTVAAEGDPAVAVSYYGSTVADALGDRDRIGCPVQFHFGAEDPYIPVAQAELVAAAAARRPDWECHIQPDAGHAFDNHDSDMFHRPDAAARAWGLTSDFLARELPTSAAARTGA